LLVAEIVAVVVCAVAIGAGLTFDVEVDWSRVVLAAVVARFVAWFSSEGGVTEGV